MKKRIFGIFICVLLLSAVVSIAACSNEAEELQARIDALEAEKTEMQSTISTLSSDLERARSDLSSTRSELQDILAALETNDDDNAQDSQPPTPSGPLAITFYGTPSTDRSWPLRDGVAEDVVGLYVNWDMFDDDLEITWRSTDDDIFTVDPSDDGLSVVVTPEKVGSAEVVATVGDQQTRAWIRIT